MRMEKLRQLRKEAKKTQQEMAELLGISNQAYSDYETGASQPNFINISKLADFFHVTVDYLMERPHKHIEYTLPDMQDIRFAFHGGTEDLTQGDLDEIAAFIKFKRQQRENENRK